jgi:hypothetical protein
MNVNWAHSFHSYSNWKDQEVVGNWVFGEQRLLLTLIRGYVAWYVSKHIRDDVLKYVWLARGNFCNGLICDRNQSNDVEYEITS